MSRQVESSSVPAAADGGVGAADEVAAAELDEMAAALDDAAWLDVGPEDESLLEHPAATSATAVSPAIENRVSCIGTSIA
ncbi:hypothetical protein GCM10023077_50380 [Mycolicibacterium helvum]